MNMSFNHSTNFAEHIPIEREGVVNAGITIVSKKIK